MSLLQTPEAQALVNGPIVCDRAVWKRVLSKRLRTGPRAAVLQCVHCLSCFWLVTISPGRATSGRMSTRSGHTILSRWLDSVNPMAGSLVGEVGRIGSDHVQGGASDAYTCWCRYNAAALSLANMASALVFDLNNEKRRLRGGKFASESRPPYFYSRWVFEFSDRGHGEGKRCSKLYLSKHVVPPREGKKRNLGKENKENVKSKKGGIELKFSLERFVFLPKSQLYRSYRCPPDNH